MKRQQTWIYHAWGNQTRVFPAVISRNMRPDEKGAYRLTWFRIGFDGTLLPRGHVVFTRETTLHKKLNKTFNQARHGGFFPGTNFELQIA